MKKIELEIVALSHSITQTHSYAVVLGEVNGLRRLPIVIGGFEVWLPLAPAFVADGPRFILNWNRLVGIPVSSFAMTNGNVETAIT